jgi:hypothetical protein
MKTIIVVIPCKYTNARKVCESIQNGTYKTESKLIEVLKSELEFEEEATKPMVLNMSDFMDLVNDQELDNLSDCFISYVTIEEV